MTVLFLCLAVCVVVPSCKKEQSKKKSVKVQARQVNAVEELLEENMLSLPGDEDDLMMGASAGTGSEYVGHAHGGEVYYIN